MEVFPTRTIQVIKLGSDTKTVPSFRGGVKGDPGDTGITGPTGNGDGYPLATAVTAAFSGYLARANVTDNDKTSWANATYQNSWASYGSGYPAARYRRYFSKIELDGLVAHPTTPSGPIFTLPSGFRPTGQMLFYVHCGEPHVGGRIDIHPNGEVHFISGDWNYLSLTGINFSNI